MTIPYNPSTPQGNQQINQTQSPIEVNFQSISDLLEVNHVGFNDSLEGNHTFVSYVQQSSDPSTSSTEMALYSKYVSGDSNLMELFYRYPNNGSVVQLTGVVNNNASNGGTFPGHVNSGTSGGNDNQWGPGCWQYLSNGILIMAWCPSNMVAPGNSYPAGSPIPLIIPSGYGAPTFTQTPFNVQYVTNFLGSTSGINTTTVACLAVSPTTINVYNPLSYSGSGSNVFVNGYFIAIGV